MRRLAIALPLVLTLLASAAAEPPLRLATTTSTEASGLLEALLPPFEKRFGREVAVIAVGSGRAIQLAENGDVDVLLSHAPELEDAFVRSGGGVNRRDVMFNDFVIVGPPDDPAGLRETKTGVAALSRLAERRAPFVSRGDESGTHQKEKALWREAGFDPEGEWYVSAGQGMGAVLLMADERRAYTLTDRGTFLAYRGKGDLGVLVDGDPALANPYSIIVVNPARHPHAQYLAAMLLVAWMTSPEGQHLIAGFRVNGERLFHPTAVPATD